MNAYLVSDDVYDDALGFVSWYVRFKNETSGHLFHHSTYKQNGLWYSEIMVSVLSDDEAPENEMRDMESYEGVEATTRQQAVIDLAYRLCERDRKHILTIEAPEPPDLLNVMLILKELDLIQPHVRMWVTNDGERLSSHFVHIVCSDRDTAYDLSLRFVPYAYDTDVKVWNRN